MLLGAGKVRDLAIGFFLWIKVWSLWTVFAAIVSSALKLPEPFPTEKRCGSAPQLSPAELHFRLQQNLKKGPWR